MNRRTAAALLLLLLVTGPGGPRPAAAAPRPTVKIGSKAFAESWILGEALTSLARAAGDADAEHSSNLGGTDIVYSALRSGAIDLYPEYTGTISQAILKAKTPPKSGDMLAALAKDGIGMSYGLGFNDGYALAVTRETARKYGLRKISDLALHPSLRLAFTHEFLERKDGWPGLAARYGLKIADVRGIQHELAYEAIRTAQIEVTDIYTTDAQIERLKLVALEDDRSFFPRYDGVLLYRLDLPIRAPRAWASLQRLIGRIDEPAMIRANGLVVLEKKTQQEAAASLLREVLKEPLAAEAAAERNVAAEIAGNVATHMRLVAISLLAAALVGIPLGILASRSPAVAAWALSTTGVLQTIPSLALLAFLIPVLGIREKPALVALFLYSLLPIVRNTYTGLAGIPANLAESAEALGLTPAARLFRVSLPMASPSIMAGLKTSAVINVGTATLAALIGAGGLGDPIWRGMQTVNTGLILQGAIPAALLALLVQGAFDLLDRVVIPRGLRLKPEGQE